MSLCSKHARALLRMAAMAILGLTATASLRAGSLPESGFEKSFAPTIVKNCLGCHNATDLKGGLDLTSWDGLRKGGKSGPAIVPGKPDESFLIERVTEGSMPPKGKGLRLSAGEVAALRAWVQAGAHWPLGRVLNSFEYTTERRAGYDWWSLQPVTHPSPPTRLAGFARAENAIDLFVQQNLHKHGLGQAPHVDRRTFIRRVTFDLLGLPPTPEEIDAFSADDSPVAYEKLIDRLLASPHYGERWGRHWLDVARFGESDGFENDRMREHAWRYRDYVVRSFNKDKPYPQFVTEQIAGDMLQPVTRDGLIATGFLVAGPWDEIQNVAKSKTEKMRTHEEEMEELIGAVTQTFLGMTVNCARCHDHKFDPIPQRDYYRIKAVFDGVEHGNRPVLTPGEQRLREQELAPVQARLQALKVRLAEVERTEPGHANIEKGRIETLAEGRFGRALDARRLQVAAKSKSVYHKPPFTVECWAKLDGRAGFNILVANNPKESSEHWEIYSYAGTGEFSAFLPGYAPAEIKSGIDITDGKWHFVAMSFDGARVRLCVDGKQAKEVSVLRQTSGGPTGALYFGSYPPHGLGCNGVVDEVRISNVLRALNFLPSAPFVADEHTVGLWHFDAIRDNRFPDDAACGTQNGLSAPAVRQSLLAELKEEEAKLAAHAVPVSYTGIMHQPEPTVVYLRGDIRKPGPLVTAAGLSPIRSPSGEFNLPPDASEGLRRLRFAEWVARADHPLTARVMVNRIWQYHFGHGLIDTPSDFGFNGGKPSHPELLDWLAQHFVADGWSVKKMHRLIMLSASYSQSSRFDAKAAAIDTDNRLLWRFVPRRLEAEEIRDAMLAVSGELNPQIGGPSFKPFTTTVFNTTFYHLFDRDTPEFNRRTLYRMMVNTAKSPLLDSLDCPSPSIGAPKRRTTTTPLQALSLMNDSFVKRQTGRFAQRLRELAGEDRDAQVDLAFKLAVGRRASGEENSEMKRLVSAHDLASACWVLLNTSEFLHAR